MKLFTVSETPTDFKVYGSPQYPFWVGKEPDIYVTEVEYNEADFQTIRNQADQWRIDLDSYQEIDHGYDQQSSGRDTRARAIENGEILVKDGAFFGIIAYVDRSFYGRSPTFHKQYEYVSITTAAIKHGLWKYHYGSSSDNGSSDDDTVYYLHPLFETE